ncbi:MAG: sigma-70 family RNA polymerase sigma factor [Planctomycetota bacterium]
MTKRSVQTSGGPATDTATAQFLRYRETGEQALVEAAFLACAPTVRRAARVLASGQGADDLVQEVFVAALRRSATFDARAPLLDWLLGILRNLSRRDVRRIVRWKRALSGRLELGRPEATEPEEVLGREEWMAAVRVRIEGLAEPYRSVVARHVLDGQRPIEIAQRLDRPASTVRTQLERGLRTLRQRLPAPLLAGLLAVQAARASTSSAWTTLARRRVVGLTACLVGVGLAWVAWGALPPPVAAPDAIPLSRRADPEPTSQSVPREREGAVAREDVPPESSAVRVRLHTPNGMAAAGVQVVLDPTFEPGLAVVRAQHRWRVARTDAEGEVAFVGLRPGRMALRIDDQAPLHTFDMARESRSFDFVIQPLVRVRVTCLDEDDRPVEAATVYLSCRAGNGTGAGFPAGRTDAQGATTVPAFAPKVFLWATATGHQASPVFGPIRSQGEVAESAAALRMPRSSRRLRGVVVGLDHAPAVGALVAAWKPSDPHPVLYASTGAGGRFAIEGLPEGPWQLAAATRDSASPALTVDSDTGAVTLRLVPGATVEGHVAAAAHSPRSDLRVVTMGLESNVFPVHPFESATARVEEDGAFRVRGLLPGVHLVGLFDLTSQAPMASQRVVAENGALVRVSFAYAAVEPWRVQVLDGQGKPIVGCHVVVQSDLQLVRAKHRQEADTDTEGMTYLLRRDTAPQVLFVNLRRDGLVGAFPVLVRRGVRPEQRTVVTLPEVGEPGKLRGTLPTSLRPLAVRDGLVLEREGRLLELAVDGDGGFAATDLPVGTYRLSLRGNEDTRSWFCTLAHVDIGAPAQFHDLGVVHDPGVGSASLVLRESAAVHPIFAILREAGGERVEQIWLTPGQSRHSTLLAGAYVLSYASDTGNRVDQTFLVRPGAETEVVLARRAGRPCRLEVHATDAWPEVTPLQATVCTESDADGWDFVVQIAADRSTWTADIDLRPGRYRFRARAPWGPEAGGPFVVREGSDVIVLPFQLR